MSDFICLDLETLSTDPAAVIVSIGAVRFNLENDETENFYVNVCPKSGKDLGLHISTDTLDWWRKQKPEAVKAWQTDSVPIQDALEQFVQFTGRKSDTTYFCLGASFDYPILQSSFNATGIQEPWKYYSCIDLRTIFWMAKFNTKDGKRVGAYHNALDDCHTQIRWLKLILAGQDPRQ